MKKKQVVILGLVLFVLGFLFLVNSSHVSAIGVNPNNAEDPLGLGINAETIPPTPEELKIQSTEYLKQEWTKILNKTIGGQVILFISNGLHTLSPIFKLLIGVEYSLSWFFYLSLVLWIALVIIIYKIIQTSFQFKSWITLGITIITVTLASQSGIIPKTITYLSPLITNGWIRTGIILLIIAILGVYLYFMKLLDKKIKEDQKKESETRREYKAKTVEKIHDIELTTNSFK